MRSTQFAPLDIFLAGHSPHKLYYRSFKRKKNIYRVRIPYAELGDGGRSLIVVIGGDWIELMRLTCVNQYKRHKEMRNRCRMSWFMGVSTGGDRIWHVRVMQQLFFLSVWKLLKNWSFKKSNKRLYFPLHKMLFRQFVSVEYYRVISVLFRDCNFYEFNRKKLVIYENRKENHKNKTVLSHNLILEVSESYCYTNLQNKR